MAEESYHIFLSTKAGGSHHQISKEIADQIYESLGDTITSLRFETLDHERLFFQIKDNLFQVAIMSDTDLKRIRAEKTATAEVDDNGSDTLN